MATATTTTAKRSGGGGGHCLNLTGLILPSLSLNCNNFRATTTTKTCFQQQ